MGIKIKKDVVAPKPVAPVAAPVVAPAKPSFIKSGASAKAALAAVMSPEEDFLGKELFQQAGDLKDQADLLMVDRSSVLVKLALLTCPYKVGDYLKLNRGLGAGGLVVEAIMACEFPAFNNRWAIQTCGIAKDGSVSRRTLLLSEWQLTNNNAGLTVLEHKKASK